MEGFERDDCFGGRGRGWGGVSWVVCLRAVRTGGVGGEGSLGVGSGGGSGDPGMCSSAN